MQTSIIQNYYLSEIDVYRYIAVDFDLFWDVHEWKDAR